MATVKLIYRKNKQMQDGSYPIALRLSNLKQPSVYIRVQGMAIDNPNEWNKELSRFTRKKKDFKLYNKILSDIEYRADTILSSLLAQNIFSYQKFKDLYLGIVVSDLVIESFNNKIAELSSLKKFGNADAYTASRNAIKEFTKKKQLVFADID